MKSSGRDCSRTSKDRVSPGSDWSHRHPEGGFNRLPRRILADVFGSLYKGSIEEYPSQVPECSFREVEGDL